MTPEVAVGNVEVGDIAAVGKVEVVEVAVLTQTCGYTPLSAGPSSPGTHSHSHCSLLPWKRQLPYHASFASWSREQSEAAPCAQLLHTAPCCDSSSLL